ncbi:MAG: histidine phosphatase family protein [Candidatus Peribacteraceae bacterium]|jgi:broad specificity phosphatase PhoE
MPYRIFSRHGESECNVANTTRRVFTGQFDTPLTPHGEEEARELGRVLAARDDIRLSLAVSSQLIRARETARLALEQLPHPVRLACIPALNERSLGIFQGRPAEEVYAEFPQYRDDPAFNKFPQDFVQKAPGGENLTDVTNRAWPVIEELEQTEGNILIVSHMIVFRCILARMFDLTEDAMNNLQIPHAQPIIVELRKGEYRLREGLEMEKTA